MKSIENYQIDYGRIYGSGQYGTVYKCIDVRDNQRKLCVKVVNYIQYEQEKFLRELKVMNAIIDDGKFNQNIVKVEMAKENKGLLYFVMEKCDQDLKQYLDDRNKSNNPMKLAEALDCFRQILNGYKVLFEYGLMHRDIKPENILIIFKNGQPIYKLADFGMAKLHKSYDKAEQTVKGTPIWASPQVFQGYSYSHKTDIYSLGLMFFFIIFGSLPYGAYGNIKNRKQLFEIQGSFKINPFIVDFNKIQDRVDLEPLKVKQLAQLIESMIRYDEDDRIQFENLFSHSLINIDAARRIDIDEDLFKTTLPTRQQQQNNHIQLINSNSSKNIVQIQNNNGIKQLQTLQPQPTNLIQQNIPLVQQNSQPTFASLQTQQPQPNQNLRIGQPIGIQSQTGQPFTQPISNNMVKPFQQIQPQNQQQIPQQNVQSIQNQNQNFPINNQQNGQHSKGKIQIFLKKKNFETILLENFQRYISINTQAENTVLDLIYICCTYFIKRQPLFSGHYQVQIEQLKYIYQDSRKQDYNNLSCIELTKSLSQLYKQNNQLFPIKQNRIYYQEYIRMISFLEFIIGSFPTDKLIQEALEYSCDPQKEIIDLIHYIQVQRTS